MLVVLCAAKEETVAAESVKQLADFLKEKEPALGRDVPLAERVVMVGPADAAVAKVNDVYKKVIYLRGADYQKLVQIKDGIERFVADNATYKNTIVQFDFNPMSAY